MADAHAYTPSLLAVAQTRINIDENHYDMRLGRVNCGFQRWARLAVRVHRAGSGGRGGAGRARVPAVARRVGRAKTGLLRKKMCHNPGRGTAFARLD